MLGKRKEKAAPRREGWTHTKNCRANQSKKQERWHLSGQAEMVGQGPRGDVRRRVFL